MAIGTYDEVKSALRNWSERQDLSDTIVDQCIFLTENDASSRLRTPAMENMVQQVVSGGTIPIPSDYLELRRLEYSGQVLQYLPWDQFQESISNNQESTMYFSRQGAKWYFSAPMADNDIITVYYYRLIPTISSANQSNWLLQVSPQIYLYGGLMYIYDYLMQTERAAYWAEKAIGEINKIQAMADMAEHRGSLLSVRAY